MKKNLLLLSILFSTFLAAQETDKKALQDLSNKFAEEYAQNQEFIQDLAQKRGVNPSELKKYIVGKYGDILVHIEVLDADQILSGNVDMLSDNTIPGIAVTGQGMVVHQWDGGRVDAEHQEYAGRITNMENDEVELSDHATGIAGVMVAQGISASAKGMAPEAEVIAYDYNNNFNELSDVSQQSTDYIISNHSYGYQAGWRWGEYDESLGQGWYWFGYPDIDGNESVLHGLYSSLDGYLDMIARSAPNHLMIKAAGNDRNSGPQEPTEHAILNQNDDWDISSDPRPVNCGQTGFDCIPYGSVAKNILTVGSVNQIGGNGRYNGPASVSSSGFSAFGPADDGRIKPDIVAQGSSVIIPVNDNNYYNNSNGTSLSTPSISGIALLLQQIYNQLNDSYLNAASLKALLLNTTNETGAHPGPDYQYGFGLVDAFQAANLIVDQQTNESVILTGSKSINDVSVNLTALGDRPIRATLVWMDAVPNLDSIAFELNSRTPMLVNDLDLRIRNNATLTEYMPWTLDVENPSAAAVPGDNLVDNVEQILIDSPSAGENFTLSITHKDFIQGLAQPYALVISGAGLATTATYDIAIDDVMIFPNPVTDFIRFAGLKEDAQIQVINMDGKLIMHQPLNSDQLNVSHLESGAYILMIKTKNNSVAKKFFKK